MLNDWVPAFAGMTGVTGLLLCLTGMFLFMTGSIAYIMAQPHANRQ